MTGGHEAEASRPFWNWSSISLEPGPGLLLASTHNNATTAGPNCSGGTVTYDFTVLLSVGCTVGVLVALYIIFRAYKLLFLTYCVTLARQTDDSAPPRHAHHTIFRLPRARGCSAPRPQRDKGATPPPPYDSPPPYHVAVVMAPGSPAPAPVEVHISDPVYI